MTCMFLISPSRKTRSTVSGLLTEAQYASARRFRLRPTVPAETAVCDAIALTESPVSSNGHIIWSISCVPPAATRLREAAPLIERILGDARVGEAVARC